MGPLDKPEYEEVLKASEFYKKYQEEIDPESAFEILSKKMETLAEEKAVEEKEDKKLKSTSRSRRKEKSTLEEMMSSSVGRQVGRELVRGFFGVLFGKTPRRSSRSRSIF
jgi:hypothetical protein